MTKPSIIPIKFILILLLFSVNLFPQGITFQNVADSLGINHTSNIDFFAGGLSFCDFNGDGLEDITLSNITNSELRFYQNSGSGFTDVGQFIGITNPYKSQQVIWADFDNDGDKDFFVTNRKDSSKLYLNDGNFQFTDITAAAGLTTANNQTQAAAWADYDNDGWLDLYVGNRALDQRNYLYHNNGDGTFTDVTEAAGVADITHLPLAISFFDFNNDGWQDIYTANDLQGGNTLFKNNGDGTFTDVSASSGADLIMSAMGIAVGDYDNNGYLDLYISNMPNGNRLLKNNGDETFTELADSVGVGLHKLGWGVQFWDYDNDGDLDIHACVSDGPGGKGDPNRQNALFQNQGDGTFVEVFGTGLEVDTSYSYGSATCDFNNDGYLDLAILNAYGTKSALWQSSGGTNNWIKFSLEGTTSNRDGIGTLFEIYYNGTKIIRSTHCGISYQSQNSFIETFGVGTSSIIDSVIVTWPSGIIDKYFNISVNQKIDLLEGETLPAGFVNTYTHTSTPMGINHTYDGPFLSGGLSFVDFNNDGFDDITFANENGQEVAFYQNNSGISFTDVQPSLVNLTNTQTTYSVMWADYDNDGDKDIFISNKGPRDKLYRNDGNSVFTDITESAGLSMDPSQTVTAAWGDYNNDGWLDLYVGHRSETVGNVLYHNNGDGTFTDVTASAGVVDLIHLPLAISFLDYNNDGWQDIYCANDLMGGNTLFKNNGDGTFQDVSASSGADLVMSAMGIAIGDYDNDDDLDMYISNLVPGNRFLQNNGDGTFNEIADELGMTVNRICWGVTFFDYDNDSDLDLLVCVSDGIERGDPARQNVIYTNNGDGTFTETVGTGLDVDTSYSYASGIGDFNNDGYSDIVISNAKGTISDLWMNDGNSNNWIKILLHGVESNAEGYGSTIEIYRSGTKIIRTTHASISYISQNSLTQTIGVGESAIIDSVKIIWPSGIVDIYYDVAVNQQLDSYEGETVVLPKEPVTFTNIAAEMGIDHSYSISFFAGGVSLIDVNGDGLDEITLSSVSNESISVYKNLTTRFKNVINNMGITDNYRSKSVLWADYDNDGDPDLFIANQGAISRLLRHDPMGNYVDVTESSGLSMDANETTCGLWLDFDNDGWLDLYIGNRSDTVGNILYRNNGDGTFSDVTLSAKVEDLEHLPLTLSIFDVTNDGWAEIYIANDLMGGNTMFRNNKDGTFKNISERSGTDLLFAAMGIAVGDYDGDGFFDIYVTNGPNGNELLRNKRNGTFEKVGTNLGLTVNKICWGANFFDYDNDTDLDLFVSVSDGYNGQGDPNRQNILFENNGDGTFVENTTSGLTSDTSYSYGSAIADLNNDGYLDLVVLNANGSKTALFQSSGGVNNWIKLKLQGIISNKDAIGSTIEAYTADKKLVRLIGSTVSFESQNSLTQVIGLGDATTVDSIIIKWPSGTVDVLTNVSANQKLTISEGSFERSGTLSKENSLPQEYVISQNYPNPFNPNTTINYQIPSNSYVKIELFNIVGEVVAELVNNYHSVGSYSIQLNAADINGGLASGIYLYRLTAVDEKSGINHQFVKKMILMK